MGSASGTFGRQWGSPSQQQASHVESVRGQKMNQFWPSTSFQHHASTQASTPPPQQQQPQPTVPENASWLEPESDGAGNGGGVRGSSSQLSSSPPPAGGGVGRGREELRGAADASGGVRSTAPAGSGSDEQQRRATAG